MRTRHLSRLLVFKPLLHRHGAGGDATAVNTEVVLESFLKDDSTTIVSYGAAEMEQGKDKNACDRQVFSSRRFSVDHFSVPHAKGWSP
jgi:hypothetical protein